MEIQSPQAFFILKIDKSFKDRKKWLF